MINKGMKEKNQEAVKELQTVHYPFENGEQLYFHRSWCIEIRRPEITEKSL
jgi:hypothetical protein